MTSKAIYVQPGGGYDKVEVGSSEAAAPQAGEITVRLHASSLNYHDFAVVRACGAQASGVSPWPMVLAKWSRSALA